MTIRQVGDIVSAKVVEIIPSGAKVKFDEKESGFLHISELRKKFVKQVEDVLQVGQEIRVIIIDKKDNKTYVSLKKVPAQEEKKVSFEDKIQNFLKESGENLKQIQKSQDKKRGLYKKPKFRH